jgi:uncharacterized membrane protein YccC
VIEETHLLAIDTVMRVLLLLLMSIHAPPLPLPPHSLQRRLQERLDGPSCFTPLT